MQHDALPVEKQRQDQSKNDEKGLLRGDKWDVWGVKVDLYACKYIKEIIQEGQANDSLW